MPTGTRSGVATWDDRCDDGSGEVISMWQHFLDLLGVALQGLHAAAVPVAGPYAWGLAIIGLTVGVRLALLPLGFVQAQTLLRRRTLVPQVRAIQRRFDTSDRLRRRDPDRFLRNLREQRAAVSALHRKHGVRPMRTMMVMVAQSPVLFGLYRLLASQEALPVLQAAPFLLIERLSLSVVTGAGVGGLLLVLVIAATTWFGQRQLARVTPREPAQPSPVAIGAITTGMMTAVATTLPAGVLLYWASTGLWTLGQQAVLLRV